MTLKNVRILAMGVLLSLSIISCIDRDTIAGTGKETPDSIVGAGGDMQSGTIRAQLPVPLRVRILSAAGRPVRGVTVEFSNPPGRVSFSDTTVRSDGDGYASTRVTLGNIADTMKVLATVIGLKGSPVTFTLVARASYESQAAKASGDNQSGTVGGPLSQPLKVRITDPYNNVVRNAQAVFSTAHGKFANAFVLSDSNGIASALWTLDTLIGTKTATVTFPTMPNLTLTFTATAVAHTPVTMSAVTNDTVHSMEGLPVPGGINVKLQDRYGNPTKSRSVRVSVIEGSPNVDTTRNYLTGDNGVASIPVTLAFGDTVVRLSVFVPQTPIPSLPFLFVPYVYSQIDSIRSSGGTVELFWEKNLNRNFLNYQVERCPNFSFDNSTVVVSTITDQNIVSVTDAAAVVGTSPFYRVKFNYATGFSFYSNIRQITVQP